MENLTATEAREISENSTAMHKILELIRYRASYGHTTLQASDLLPPGMQAGLKKLGYEISENGYFISW